MTKLGAKRIHTVRTRGGNQKHRALRLESGNYAWGSEHTTRKTRIIGVVYNASNNELVRTNTLVKSCIVQIDAAPFRQWYEAHYGQPIVKKGRVSFSRIPLLLFVPELTASLRSLHMYHAPIICLARIPTALALFSRLNDLRIRRTRFSQPRDVPIHTTSI